MPQRPPAQLVAPVAPAEVLSELNLGYNGYTDPRLTNPKMWAPGTANVSSGAFGYLQRSRFANIKAVNPTTGKAIITLKFFALPGLSAYVLADINGKLFSYDTGASYMQTQRLNPYVDPSGTGSASLNGPWSREVLQNIVYEMNGTVKQAGKGANGATIEGWGLDAPDASPQVGISIAGASQNITAISRSNGVVSVTLANPLTVPGSNLVGMVNVSGNSDTSFNGTFLVQTGSGTANLTWNQPGQNVSGGANGTVDVNITKSVGRSYAYAWENTKTINGSTFTHVSAPSPSTQFIAYSAQNGVVQLVEQGTITTNGTTTVTGTGTAFTAAWIGRSLWVTTLGSVGRITAVASATSLTLAASAVAAATQAFQIFDPQSTHLRLYQTADGQATYFRAQRNAFVPSATTLVTAGLQFFDNGNSEPPNSPFTTETSQLNNVPPPIGQFVNEYQGRLCVYGVSGVPQAFFYSNQETTLIGQPQESFAPLNQITLPIANGKINGMLEFPGSLIIWSDKQDMFRLSGLLTDNTFQTAANQGASISRLPYNLGSASPFASDITPLGGIWLTSNGEIWLFTDRYAPRNIGRPVQDILNTITPTNLSLARARYYHTGTRNWWVLSVAANGAAFNNTLLVLDLDLLASNGSPSYFTFDMATNHPSWWVIQPGPVNAQGVTTPRCDSLETVIEAGGAVRLVTGGVDLIQDADYQTQNSVFGMEIAVNPAPLILHAWGNDTAHTIKRPTFIRFTTNRPPSTLAADGWSFAAQGIDDDFYNFDSPLTLALTPGVNDTSTLGGNQNLSGGSPFRHSPELYRIGGVNFVAGRRLKFQVNFPTGPGNFQLNSIQIGAGATPPR